MMIKKIIIILMLVPLINCAGYEKKKSTKSDERIYYSSSGFALIYNDSLYENEVINKKINNDQILLLHANLKRNTSDVNIKKIHHQQAIRVLELSPQLVPLL